MNAPTPLRFNIPAELEQLSTICRVVVQLLEQNAGLAARSRLAYEIELGVNELSANIIQHAYAGSRDGLIYFLVEASPGRFALEARDRGQVFTRSERSGAEPVLGQERGYGLFLLHQLMDRVTYERDVIRGENVWRLEKTW